ncbi:hypothetical protein ES708_27183 [subsurface metagenome]
MPLTNVWRPFKDETIELTPKEPGAYELGYRDAVVYIGSSESSIQSRLRQHRKRKTFMKVTHFRFRRTSSHEARALEDKLCTEFVKKNGKPPRLQERMPKEPNSLAKRFLYG